MTTEFLPDHDHILLTLLPDPSKVPDMPRSRRMSELYSPIHTHFELWPDVLVGSNGYLCRDGNDPDNWVKMDLVVTRDVMPDAIIGRNGYIIDEVGKPPDFVLEVVPECLFYDESSGKFGLVADMFGEVRPDEVRRDYDYERNRRLLAGYGVREYWRLSASPDDPQQDVPLAGLRLVDGVYEPIPITTESYCELRGHSAALDLHLCWDGTLLRWMQTTGGRMLPGMKEQDETIKDLLAVLRAERKRHAEVEYERFIANEKVRLLDGLLRENGVQPDAGRFRDQRDARLDELSRQLAEASHPWTQ